MLLPDQRALLVTHCSDHPIAACSNCSEVLRFEQIVGDVILDVILDKRDSCPVCRTDLTFSLLQHFAECTVKRVQQREIRDRARETRLGDRVVRAVAHWDSAVMRVRRGATSVQRGCGGSRRLRRC